MGVDLVALLTGVRWAVVGIDLVPFVGGVEGPGFAIGTVYSMYCVGSGFVGVCAAVEIRADFRDFLGDALLRRSCFTNEASLPDWKGFSSVHILVSSPGPHCEMK